METAKDSELPQVPVLLDETARRGKHKPPTCDHGEWKLAGSDAKRGASRVRLHVDLTILATLADSPVRLSAQPDR